MKKKRENAEEEKIPYVSEYFIMLPKFDDQSCQKWTMKEAWLETIKNIGMTNEIDPRVYELADEGLLTLIEKAKVSALSPEEYALYLAEMKIIGDSNAPEMYGYNQGKKEETLRFAKELKTRGMPIEEIAEISHLSREEIEQM